MTERIELDWYTLSRHAIQRHYPKDWRKFAGYLAATSVNATVKANLTLAKKALLGDKFAVVVDRWMARAYGYESVTPKNYPVIHCAIIRESEENNMLPAEYQAQLWAETRGAGESFSDLLNERSV